MAVPNGVTADGTPFGVTFLAPAGRDAYVAGLAAEFQARTGLTLGATPYRLPGGAVPADAVPADAGRRPVAGDIAVFAVIGAHRTAAVKPCRFPSATLGGYPTVALL